MGRHYAPEMAFRKHPLQSKIQVDPKGASEEICELYKRAKCSRKVVAGKLEVSPGTLIRWIKALDDAGMNLTKRLEKIKGQAYREGWHHADTGGRPATAHR